MGDVTADQVSALAGITAIAAGLIGHIAFSMFWAGRMTERNTRQEKEIEDLQRKLELLSDKMHESSRTQAADGQAMHDMKTWMQRMESMLRLLLGKMHVSLPAE